MVGLYPKLIPDVIHRNSELCRRFFLKWDHIIVGYYVLLSLFYGLKSIRIIHAVSELSLVYGQSSHYFGVLSGCYHLLKGKDTLKCKQMASDFSTISSNE